MKSDPGRHPDDVPHVVLALQISAVHPAKVTVAVPADQMDHRRRPERIEKPFIPLLRLLPNVGELVAMIVKLVEKYRKGAITEYQLMMGCLQRLDPQTPDLVLSGLPEEVLDEMLDYARRYDPRLPRS